MIDRYGMDRTPMIVYFVGPIVGGILGVLVYDFRARARVGGTPLIELYVVANELTKRMFPRKRGMLR